MRWIFLLLVLVGCQSAAPQPSPSPLVLIGIGDSITSGFGASPGRSYFEQLEQRLQPREARNFARAATTSPQHLEQQLPNIPTYSREVFGVVCITTGGNDLIHNYGHTPPRPDAMYGATFEQAQPWLEQFGPRLDRLLDGVAERFPGGHRVFLANIYDPTDGVGDLENAGLGLPPWPDAEKFLRAYNGTIGARAHRATIIDLEKLFHGHGIHHGRQPYWYYANLEDPNNEGYDAIADAFERAIRLGARP